MTPGFIQFAHLGTPVAPPPPVYPGDVVEEIGLQQNAALFDRRSLAVRNDGDAVVAWRRVYLSGGFGYVDYYMARRANGSWQAPVRLGGTPSLSAVYGASLTDSGAVLVVARNGYSANLYRYENGSTTTIPVSAGWPQEGRAIGFPNGDILFVYWGRIVNSGEYLILSKRYTNGAWGPIRTIGSIRFGETPNLEVAVSPDWSEAVVAYRAQQADGTERLVTAISANGGDTWAAPVTMAPVTPTAVDVSYDLQGNANLVYAYQKPDASLQYGLGFNRLQGGQWQHPLDAPTMIDESDAGIGFTSDLTVSGSSLAYRKNESVDGALVANLYIRDYVNGAWSDPVLITPATSSAKGCLVTLANGERGLGTRELEPYTENGRTYNRTSVDFWVRRGSTWQTPVRPAQLVVDGKANNVAFNPVLAMSPNRRVALGVSGIDVSGAYSTDRLFATVYTPN